VLFATRRDETTGFVAPEGPASISLRPSVLSHDDAESLLSLATEDSPLRPDEIRALAERSGGNPLFLRELLVAVRQPGGLSELPSSIEAMVVAQIDRLPPADRKLLRYASVLGMNFDDPLMGALLEGEGQRYDS